MVYISPPLLSVPHIRHDNLAITMLRIAIFWGLILFASAENQNCSVLIPSSDTDAKEFLNRITNNTNDIAIAKAWFTKKFPTANQESEKLISEFNAIIRNVYKRGSKACDHVFKEFRSNLTKSTLERYEKRLLEQYEEDKDILFAWVIESSTFFNQSTFADHVNEYFTQQYYAINVIECADWIENYSENGTPENGESLKDCAEPELDSMREFCKYLIESPDPDDMSGIRRYVEMRFENDYSLYDMKRYAEKLRSKLQGIVDGIKQDK